MQDSHGNVIDKLRRKVVPSECFAFFIYAAALYVCSKLERFDYRVSPAAVIDALSESSFSAGSLSDRGGRPSSFSISVRDVVIALGATFPDDEASPSSSYTNIDAALNNLSSARNRIFGSLGLRRFLSLHPQSWPSTATDTSVIDGFRAGSRRSIVWSGPSMDYMRHKLESLASLMGVCMPHTNPYDTRASGVRHDDFRCHRRARPKDKEVRMGVVTCAAKQSLLAVP